MIVSVVCEFLNNHIIAHSKAMVSLTHLLQNKFLQGYSRSSPCQGEDVYWEFQVDGIRRADGTRVMTVAPPRVCVVIAGLSWVP